MTFEFWEEDEFGQHWIKSFAMTEGEKLTIMPYTVDMSKVLDYGRFDPKLTKYNSLVNWCKNNIKAYWTVSGGVFYFSDTSEALMFKLTIC